MPTPKLPDYKRKEIVRLGSAGKLTRMEIAERVKVSVGSVSHVLKAEGITSKRKILEKQKYDAAKAEMQKGGTFREIAARAGVDERFVRYAKLKDEPAKPLIHLPPGISKNYAPFVIDTPGMWGIISDIHIPCHDDTTLKLFVQECKRRAVKGIILNGDTLDSHEVSDHDRDPSMPRYAHELELGKQFLQWLHQELPRARKVYKHGNHEERVNRYIFRRAPALEGLAGINIRSWLEMDTVGVEDLPGKRIINLGKLHVIHGHEIGKGGGGVNPARWLFLKARSVAVCGHFHRPSEHHERNIALKYEAAWSMGCACDLHPEYLPYNSWQHGFGFCEVANDGNFAFENKRIFDGRIV